MFLYDEFNGYEFENSNIRLQMSLVPSDMKFTQKPRDEAKDLPANYEFDFEKKMQMTRALGHSDVKLTWDQTDVKRT